MSKGHGWWVHPTFTCFSVSLKQHINGFSNFQVDQTMGFKYSESFAWPLQCQPWHAPLGLPASLALWTGLIEAMHDGARQQVQRHPTAWITPLSWWGWMTPPLNPMKRLFLVRAGGYPDEMILLVLYAYLNIAAKRPWDAYQSANTAFMLSALTNGSA